MAIEVEPASDLGSTLASVVGLQSERATQTRKPDLAGGHLEPKTPLESRTWRVGLDPRLPVFFSRLRLDFKADPEIPGSPPPGAPQWRPQEPQGEWGLSTKSEPAGGPGPLPPPPPA